MRAARQPPEVLAGVDAVRHAASRACSRRGPARTIRPSSRTSAPPAARAARSPLLRAREQRRLRERLRLEAVRGQRRRLDHARPGGLPASRDRAGGARSPFGAPDARAEPAGGHGAGGQLELDRPAALERMGDRHGPRHATCSADHDVAAGVDREACADPSAPRPRGRRRSPWRFRRDRGAGPAAASPHAPRPRSTSTPARAPARPDAARGRPGERPSATPAPRRRATRRSPPPPSRRAGSGPRARRSARRRRARQRSRRPPASTSRARAPGPR